MARLSQADLRGMLAFLRTCETFADVASLRTGMLPVLKGLIRCDHLAYNEVDMATGAPFWILHPRDTESAADPEAFVRWVHQHPVVIYHASHAGGKAVQLADFMTRRELHRLELYNDFFKPLEIEHQLAITIPAPGNVLLGLPFNRAERVYSERDRLLLDLLRPHLAHLYGRAHARASARQALSRVEGAASRSGRAVVLLGRGERVERASGLASESLARYFPADRSGHGRLPGKVAAWVRSERRRLSSGDGVPAVSMPLVVAAGDTSLSISFLPATGADEADALLLEERCDQLMVDDLAAMGLTAREANVLRCADRGLANAQIARELGISARTVAKHFEHINAKLGVATRTAALAQARGAS